VKKWALTFGRYSPPTLAHLSLFSSILSNWECLAVGVVDSGSVRPIDIPSVYTEFCDLADEKNILERNPFTPDERVRMLSAAISHFWQDRVIQVFAIKRPEYNQAEFMAKFPPQTFDLVFPYEEGRSELFDSVRNRVFQELLGRKIFFVKPELILHGRVIRKLIANGGSWREFIPAGALEVFLAINGPQRMQAVVAKEKKCSDPPR